MTSVPEVTATLGGPLPRCASGAANLDMALGPCGALVNRASSERPELLRVEPFAPDNSYPIHKLRGNADILGDRMPQGGPYLSAAELALFVSWIEDGAKNN